MVALVIHPAEINEMPCVEMNLRYRTSDSSWWADINGFDVRLLAYDETEQRSRLKEVLSTVGQNTEHLRGRRVDRTDASKRMYQINSFACWSSKSPPTPYQHTLATLEKNTFFQISYYIASNVEHCKANTPKLSILSNHHTFD